MNGKDWWRIAVLVWLLMTLAYFWIHVALWIGRVIGR